MHADYEAARATWLVRIIEFGRGLPPDAAVSHLCAALLRGYATWGLPTKLTATRRRGHPTRIEEVTCYIACLDDDVSTHDGIAATAGPRTVLDLARHLPLAEALVTADFALRQGMTKRQLRAAQQRQYNWPGAARAQRIIRVADGRSESPAESFGRGRIIQAGFPAPICRRSSTATTGSS